MNQVQESDRKRGNNLFGERSVKREGAGRDACARMNFPQPTQIELAGSLHDANANV